MQYPTFFATGLVMTLSVVTSLILPQTAVAQPAHITDLLQQLYSYRSQLVTLQSRVAVIEQPHTSTRLPVAAVADKVVPFYSQFTDITDPAWQKVGCGVASVAMLIDYYIDEQMDVDALLQRGRDRGAYLTQAGWTHAGLVGLARDYGLTGESVSLAHLGKEAALRELAAVVSDGPVMASVHYTFEPTNPIPHLVVIHGMKDGQVFYNDPAEPSGYGTLSEAQFARAWKLRYITIRPDERVAWAR